MSWWGPQPSILAYTPVIKYHTKVTPAATTHSFPIKLGPGRYIIRSAMAEVGVSGTFIFFCYSDGSPSAYVIREAQITGTDTAFNLSREVEFEAFEDWWIQFTGTSATSTTVHFTVGIEKVRT